MTTFSPSEMEKKQMEFLQKHVNAIMGEIDKFKGPLDVLMPLTELQMHNTDVENPHALRLLHQAFAALLANIKTVQFGVDQGLAAFAHLESMEDFESAMKEMKEVCGFDLTAIMDKVRSIDVQMKADFERITTLKAVLPEVVG